MTAKLIRTTEFAESLRRSIIRPDRREVLISRLQGSEQANDLTLPPNCEGFGRIRHFRRATAPNWPSNVLPVAPACSRLGLPDRQEVQAQVFQNAACAWRCWYCYVPYNLLAGDERHSRWFTAGELVDLYLAEPNRPSIIDLSGGSPDLTPEWIVWTMNALEERGLSTSTYLWSDDNLSTDYMFSILSSDERAQVANYRNYGRACCFKGFDEASFSFNTQANSDGYERQFQIFSEYLRLGIDLYGYVTLTGPDPVAPGQSMSRFVDRLQLVSRNLPLRLVPLRIESFAPMLGRLDADAAERARLTQELAISAWNLEIERRFTPEERSLRITNVELGSR